MKLISETTNLRKSEVSDHAKSRMTYLTRARRDAAGPDAGAVSMMTSRVLRLPSGDQAFVVIERVALLHERIPMKPLPEPLKTSLDITDDLARKGRAYEYLSKGGDPERYDDQAVLRVVLPKWQRMGSPLWPVEYRFPEASVAEVVA